LPAMKRRGALPPFIANNSSPVFFNIDFRSIRHQHAVRETYPRVAS
jgi:hypothetical protein